MVSRFSEQKRAQGSREAAFWNPLLQLRVSLLSVSYSGWLAKEKGGKLCDFKWLHLLFLLFEASLLFLPTDAQFTYVAALINSKQVDSLYKYQGHQVSKCFPKYPTQNGFRFVFRLNFVPLTQMQLSAECHWDTTRDSQELVLKNAQPSASPGFPGHAGLANLCSGLGDSISVSSVALF